MKNKIADTTNERKAELRNATNRDGEAKGKET